MLTGKRCRLEVEQVPYNCSIGGERRGEQGLNVEQRRCLPTGPEQRAGSTGIKYFIRCCFCCCCEAANPADL